MDDKQIVQAKTSFVGWARLRPDESGSSAVYSPMFVFASGFATVMFGIWAKEADQVIGEYWLSDDGAIVNFRIFDNVKRLSAVQCSRPN